MEFRQLEYFRKIYEYESFTVAAERLYVSQSTLSKSMKRLEEELGMTLFEIVGKRTRPTAAARILYENSLKVDLAYNSIMDQLSVLKEDLQGDVRIASAYQRGAQFWIFDMMDHFHKENKKVNFEMKDIEPEDVIKCVESGEADLGLAASFNKKVPHGLIRTPLIRSQLWLLIHNENPLATKNPIDYEDFRHQTVFINYTEASTFFEDECKRRGFLPEIIITTNQLDAIHSLVAKNRGVGIIEFTPDSMLHYMVDYDYPRFVNGQKNWVYRPMPQENFSYELVMYTRENIKNNLCAERFSRYLVNEAEKLSEVHFDDHRFWNLDGELQNGNYEK